MCIYWNIVVFLLCCGITDEAVYYKFDSQLWIEIRFQQFRSIWFHNVGLITRRSIAYK